MENMFNDPFFAMHQQQMRNMNGMFMQPFGGMMGSPFMALPDGRIGQQRDRQRRSDRQQNQIAIADPFGGMFGNMHGMMNTMMADMHAQTSQVQQSANNHGGHAYSHSSVMSYSNTGSGQPKVFQATQSTSQAPGGVKEIRKSLRDSERGVEKMTVGRHIQNRAHVQTKERDRSGNMNEEEELINLDDGERDTFDREWQERTRRGDPYRSVNDRHLGGRSHAGRDRYESRRHQRPPHRQTPPALEYREPRY